MKRSILGIGLVCIALMTSGAICRSSGQQPAAFTLSYWTVQTASDEVQPVIDAFQAKYPYISIEVQAFRPDEYEAKLIEAWAQGQGPDIFSLPNHHIGAFRKLIAPIPTTLKLTAVTVQESLGRKETVVAAENIKGIAPTQVNTLFPQVVYDDVVQSGAANTAQVYGLPLSLDTMVLYYNKDLLDTSNIPTPAITWDDFVKQVPTLTLTDINDNIIQAGTALGTSVNVPRMFDIVSVLMMQNGATMTTSDNVSFANSKGRDDATVPGVQAVEFYTSFADPAVDWYSWNAEQPDALESFISGKIAYFFGYYYQLDTINSRGGQLDFGIAPLPQVSADPLQAINYAHYWVETVSVNTSHTDAAWAFVQALTTNETNVAAILESNPQPTALRSLLDAQKEDFTLAVFANQALSAQSWYAGQYPAEAEQAFADMVTAVNDGRLDVATAVENTADKIQLTYE